MVFRVLDIGAAATERTSAAGKTAPSTAAAANVILDPSAEGAVRALDTAGFEKVADEDAAALISETRAQSNDGALYATLSDAQAAQTAANLAFDIFFVTPNSLATSGDTLYATTQDEGALVVFRRNPDSGSLDMADLKRDGVDGVSGLARPQDVTVSPDAANVYVASLARRRGGVRERANGWRADLHGRGAGR